jgi:hypothetical protein
VNTFEKIWEQYEKDVKEVMDQYGCDRYEAIIRIEFGPDEKEKLEVMREG